MKRVTRIYLVRHGKAAASWGEGHDPGLDPLGLDQAKMAARTLSRLGPLSVISSPVRRARETAAPLSALWRMTPRIDSRVGEIPSPTDNLTDRTQWLKGIMAGTWASLDADLKSWRQGVLDALLSLREDTVVFSHFIAINAAVGAATDDDRIVSFWPDNGSITVVEAGTDRLGLAERGAEGDTQLW